MNCLAPHTVGSKIRGAIFEKLVESLSVKFAKYKDFDSFLDACSPIREDLFLEILHEAVILDEVSALKKRSISQ
ncbi:MAG: hypothetical protein Q7U74_03275 [Saprospiraceae bacterium]|nr:hypothetical protein [Saprospiraceae bacterium]